MAKNDEQAVRDAGAPDDANVKAGLPDRKERRQAQEQSSSREPRFSVERLLARGGDGPRITGHPRHVIAGALAGSKRGSFTRAEIDKRIEDFLGRELKQEA